MKRYRPNYMLMVLDACLVTLSFYFAYWMRFEGNIPARYMSEFKQLLPLQIVCTLVSCFFMRSYNKLWLYADPTDRIAHILGCFIGFGLVMLIVYLFQLPVRSAKIFLLAFLCIAGTTSMSRFMYRYMLLARKKKKHREERRNGRRDGKESRRLLIYGAGHRRCGADRLHPPRAGQCGPHRLSHRRRPGQSRAQRPRRTRAGDGQSADRHRIAQVHRYDHHRHFPPRRASRCAASSPFASLPAVKCAGCSA